MLERMRRNSSLKRSKPKSRKWLHVDISCCSNVLMCIKNPFKAQRMKWWSFNKHSNHAAMQGTYHNSDANCSSSAYPTSRSRSSPQYTETYKKKQALIAVAVATVAAAEAAIVAAEVATHMAQLTVPAANSPRRGTCSLHAKTLAAIKIQSAFRGYSVRKAIRVKSKAGLVRLQARARGRVGQMQCVTTMQCMQAFVRAQQAGVRRQPCKQETQANASTPMHNTSKEICHESTITHAIIEDSGLASRHYKEWDKSTKRLEEIEARHETKRKAAVKRERAMAYSAFLHQQLTNEDEPHSHKDSKLHWNWLERWMASRLHANQNCYSTKYAEKPPLPPPTPKRAAKWPSPLESWSLRANRQVSYQNSSSASSNASGDVQSVASFSGMPSYMADTESTRAKVRAHSAPRQRLGAKCIPLLQQQPCLPAHHSSFCPRHLSHMTHSEHHGASTNTNFSLVP